MHYFGPRDDPDRALREALEIRPKPKDIADAWLVFITKYGRPWAKDTADNSVSKVTAKGLRQSDLQWCGVNFRALRHTFKTVGGSRCEGQSLCRRHSL